MAKRCPALCIDVEGEKHTSHGSRLDLAPRLAKPFLKINYLILAPWIILSLPSPALGQQSIPVAAAVAIIGFTGMLLGSRAAIFTASVSLLLLIVWGKVAGDIHGAPGPDSALLLLQFMLVIFLMEASITILTSDSAIKELGDKSDELSSLARLRVTNWERAQLFSLGKLMLASFGLSLGLSILGSLVSVPVNQIAFSGILVLAAVVAIFVLITYRREPEHSKRVV